MMAPMVRGSELAFRMMVRRHASSTTAAHHEPDDANNDTLQNDDGDGHGDDDDDDIRGGGSDDGSKNDYANGDINSTTNRLDIDYYCSPMLRANEVIAAYKYWKEYLQGRIVENDDDGGRHNNNHDVERKFQIKVWKDWKKISTMLPGSRRNSTTAPNHNHHQNNKNGCNTSTTTRKLLHEDGLLFLTDLRQDDDDDRQSLVIQLCGNCPQTLYEATNAILERCDYLSSISDGNSYTNNFDNSTEKVLLHGIDLNLGCPQSCAKQGHFGAFLAQGNPTRAVECVSSMRQAIDDYCSQAPSEKVTDDILRSNNKKKIVPPKLSCKMRLLDTMEQAIDLVVGLQNVGCDVVAIHCRHRTTKHNGIPNMDAGQQIIDALSLSLQRTNTTTTTTTSNHHRMQVVFNGNIETISDIHDTYEKYPDIYGVMIGRALLENPFFLSLKTNRNGNSDLAAYLAATYLDYAEQYPPPSMYYVQKHLRWIFRKTLATIPSSTLESKFDHNDSIDNAQCIKEYYNDWRTRIWTFLVRPYIQSIEQFRLVVLLYLKMKYEDDATSQDAFSSIQEDIEQILGTMPQSLQRLWERCQQDNEPITFQRIRHYRSVANVGDDDMDYNNRGEEECAQVNNIFQ